MQKTLSRIALLTPTQYPQWTRLETSTAKGAGPGALVLQRSAAQTTRARDPKLAAREVWVPAKQQSEEVAYGTTSNNQDQGRTELPRRPPKRPPNTGLSGPLPLGV